MWNRIAFLLSVSQACMRTCYQLHVIENCACADSYFPEGSVFHRPEIPVCSSDNISQGEIDALTDVD